MSTNNGANGAANGSTKAERLAAADPKVVAELRKRLEGRKTLAQRIDQRYLLRNVRLDETDGFSGPGSNSNKSKRKH
jgi:hypothetical protein